MIRTMRIPKTCGNKSVLGYIHSKHFSFSQFNKKGTLCHFVKCVTPALKKNPQREEITVKQAFKNHWANIQLLKWMRCYILTATIIHRSLIQCLNVKCSVVMEVFSDSGVKNKHLVTLSTTRMWELTAQTGEVKPSTAACIPSETKGMMFSPRRVSRYRALRMFRAWTCSTITHTQGISSLYFCNNTIQWWTKTL